MVPELAYVADELDRVIPQLEEVAGGFQRATAEFGFQCPVSELERMGIGPGYVAPGLD